MSYFEDHGLPLVQLKERRRELVVALMGRKDPISKDQIAEIAALQHAIAAIEAVGVDLVAEVESVFAPEKQSRLRLVAEGPTSQRAIGSRPPEPLPRAPAANQTQSRPRAAH